MKIHLFYNWDKFSKFRGAATNFGEAIKVEIDRLKNEVIMDQNSKMKESEV